MEISPIKLQDSIAITAHRLSNKICMQMLEHDKWYRLTYQELQTNIKTAGNLLKNIGIKKGDRVILLCENQPRAVIAFLAILEANATAVLIDPQLPKPDLKKCIDFIDARALLVSQKYLHTIDSEMTRTLAVRNIQNNFTPCEGHHSYVPINLPSLDTDCDVAAITFTSGTTGHSLGVMLTHSNFIASFQKVGDAINLQKEDRFLSFLPFHHILILTFNLVGLSRGIMITFIEKIDGATILSAMQATRPTLIAVVPLLLDAFLKKIEEEIAKKSKLSQAIIRLMLFVSHKVRSITHFNIGLYLFYKVQKVFGGSMRLMACGGASSDQAILQKLENFGFTIVEGYGLTETIGACIVNPMKKRKLGSVGIPYPGIQAKVQNPDQKGVGEIVVSGSLVMKAYFRNPNATRDAFRDGWFHTGDLGYIDINGYLTITGRMKEIIVLASGKKVIPTEIEQYYQNIEGIEELAIFGMQQRNSIREEIHAAVVLDKKVPIQFEDDPDHIAQYQAKIKNLIHQRSSQLPVHYRIHRVHFMETLPKTAMLKIKRTLVKSWAEEQNLKNQLPIKATDFSEIAPHAIEKIKQDLTAELNISNTEYLARLSLALRHYISNLLGIPIEQINNRSDFYELGIDSLMESQLKSMLELKFGDKIFLDSYALLEYRNIADLSQHILKRIETSNEDIQKMLEKNSDLNTININESSKLPLSANEDWLWRLKQLEPNSPAYSIPVVFQWDGQLNTQIFNSALHYVIQCHDALRTSYHSNEDIYRTVHKNIDPAWQSTYDNLSHYTLAEFETALKRTVRQFEAIPFDLSVPPLMKVHLIQKNDEQWIIVFVLSHFIFDGWSINIFMKDLFNNYYQKLKNGTFLAIPAPGRKYHDFVADQFDLLRDDKFHTIKEFWKQQAKKRKEPDFKYDGNSQHDRLQSDVIRFFIDSRLLDQIKIYCKNNSYTPYIVFLSAWQKTLCQFYSLEDISLKLLSANRDAFQSVIGYFANGLLFNNNVKSNQDIHSLTAITKDILVRLHRHQIFPFQWLHKLIANDNQKNCKMAFNWHSYLHPTKNNFPIKPLMNLVSSHYMWDDGQELSCNFYPDDHSINGLIRYRTSLFSRVTLEKLIETYFKQLGSIADHESCKV